MLVAQQSAIFVLVLISFSALNGVNKKPEDDKNNRR